MITRVLKREYFSNVRADLLSGILVALAMIPEAIAFSFVAGVDPKVGLYAASCIAIVTAIAGGRPGLISGAAGSMALLMPTLVKEHGLPYLLAATVLAGILQIVCGRFKLGRQMKYVPRAVMLGFVNALGILIFTAQIPQIANASWQVYLMLGVGLAIIYGLPRFTRVLPSALVAIALLTAISILTGVDVPTVGDIGQLPTTLPTFSLPQVPLTLETLKIILPYSITLTVVGLLESWLTAALLDELTDTSSDKNREAQGQGIANIVAGLFGGMAGCALIGQSVINIQSGGRQRLSTLSAGVLLLFFILLLGDWVKQIPMASLVAVMVMVAFSTFSWSSLKTIHLVPRSEAVVTITTVVTTLYTHNLAIGVAIGIILSALFFSRKIAKLVFIDTQLSPDGTKRIYGVAGQLFFISVNDFLDAFNFKEALEHVKIDLTYAHIWDQSAVDAIDKVVLKFRKQGVAVELVGLNEASATLLNKLAVHDKPESLSTLH